MAFISVFHVSALAELDNNAIYGLLFSLLGFINPTLCDRILPYFSSDSSISGKSDDCRDNNVYFIVLIFLATMIVAGHHLVFYT